MEGNKYFWCNEKSITSNSSSNYFLSNLSIGGPGIPIAQLTQPPLITVTTSTTPIYPTQEIKFKQNIVMQSKVAIFKVERNEDNSVKSTQFIKELWVETKNGSTVDFQVARDKDLEKYESSELVIKVLLTVTF